MTFALTLHGAATLHGLAPVAAVGNHACTVQLLCTDGPACTAGPQSLLWVTTHAAAIAYRCNVLALVAHSEGTVGVVRSCQLTYYVVKAIGVCGVTYSGKHKQVAQYV